MMEAYSKEGLMRELYARSLVSVFARCKRRLRYPNFLHALEVTCSMCPFQLKFDIKYTPRYLNEDTGQMLAPRILYWLAFGRTVEANCMCLVFEILISICHILHHSVSLFRSVCSEMTSLLLVMVL